MLDTSFLLIFQLQLDKIRQRLEHEKSNEDAIKEKRRIQERAKDDIQLDYINRCRPELQRILFDILSDDNKIEELIANAKIDENDAEERIQKIREFLTNGQFDDVSVYIIQLDALVGHHGEWKSLRVVEQVLYFVTLLHSYLFDDYVS